MVEKDLSLEDLCETAEILKYEIQKTKSALEHLQKHLRVNGFFSWSTIVDNENEWQTSFTLLISQLQHQRKQIKRLSDKINGRRSLGTANESVKL